MQDPKAPPRKISREAKVVEQDDTDDGATSSSSSSSSNNDVLQSVKFNTDFVDKMQARDRKERSRRTIIGHRLEMILCLH